jgi:hypothetical protein
MQTLSSIISYSIVINNTPQPSSIPKQITPSLYHATPPHWEYLKDGPSREYTGNVYNKAIVKKVYPSELYGWEHTKTTPSLVDVARDNAWEENAIPPIELVYSETPVNGYHYAIRDGHHRKNAASRASSELGIPVSVPAMITGKWIKDVNGDYVGYGGAPFSSSFPTDTNWNLKNAQFKTYIKEGIKKNNVWGTSELQIILSKDKVSLSLSDIAENLNSFIAPPEFFKDDKGNTVIVRISLEAVYGHDGSKPGDVIHTIILEKVDTKADDWHSILKDNEKIATKLNRERRFSVNKDEYAVLIVKVQQSSFFVSPGF